MRSTHPNEVVAVKVGEPAPDFTLFDTNGKAYTLSESLIHSPVVLVFYRGDW